jgi:hypothetical protein
VCVIALVIFGSMGFPLLIRLVAAWDAAALTVFVLLLLRLILGITMPCSVERAEARAQDEGFGWIIFRGFVVIMSVAVLVLTFLELVRIGSLQFIFVDSPSD